MPKLVTDVERQQRCRAIRDAVATEITSYGYDRSDIGSIAVRAGRGPGTTYLYVDGKEEVLRALLDRIGTLIDGAIRDCLVSDLRWEDRLVAMLLWRGMMPLFPA